MAKKIPSLNWLRVFETAARTESFARAAELLDMSTSAVSQQIKALELHFGEVLFKRGARQVELTGAYRTEQYVPKAAPWIFWHIRQWQLYIA